MRGPFSKKATKAAGDYDATPVCRVAGGPGQRFLVGVRLVGMGAARIKNPDGERRQGKG